MDIEKLIERLRYLAFTPSYTAFHDAKEREAICDLCDADFCYEKEQDAHWCMYEALYRAANALTDLRAENARLRKERDSAILFAQCYTEKVDNPCTVCRHRFNENGAPLKKRCENCGLTGTPECGWEFDFDWDLKSEVD